MEAPPRASDREGAGWHPLTDLASRVVELGRVD